jgi:hypothetical protein
MMRAAAVVTEVCVLLFPLGMTSDCAGDPESLVGATQSAQAGSLPPEIQGDPEAQAFLAASAVSSDPSTDPESLISVQRSETGAVRMVFGSGFRVSFSTIGCFSADLAENARCFLRHFQQSFRLTDPEAELSLLKVRKDPHGEFVVIFNQQHLGFPVFGRQVLVTISPAGEVTHVYSTLALPLTGPGEVAVQSAFATSDASQCLEAAQTHLRDDSLRAGPMREVLWPVLSGDSFVAVPALSLSTFKPGETEFSRLFVVDVMSLGVLETRSLVASLPIRVMQGYARHPGMSLSSSHPTCSSDGDCGYLGQGWICSNDFSPRRCVQHCSSDEDCSIFDYKCFLPASNPELGGYCHWEAVTGSEPLGYPVWWSGGSWYNSALSDHKAYRHIQESLNALVNHHFYDMDLTSSYDEEDGPYWVNIHSQCFGCQNPPPEQCDCACEYTGCGGASGSVNFGTPRVSLRYWKNLWASTYSGSVGFTEDMMGHEWGHVLIGSAYGWEGSGFPPGCVGESAADTYGALFGVTRLGGSYAYPGCGGYNSTPFKDDRAGLNPGCRAGWLKSYAYRSRFDLLDCGETRQWYATCSDDSVCPAYQVCKEDKTDGLLKCTNSPDGHNGGYVFVRLVRILVEGAGAFASDGHSEDLGIPHGPLGLATTIHIMNYANRRMSSTTTMKDWMNLILSGGSAYGKYTQVYRALGASGFFPNQTLLASYTTDRDPLTITFPAWYYPSDKTFVIWKESGAYNLKVKYNNGGTPTVATISANTAHRPTAVVHGNYLHIYFRDRTTAQIKVQLIHYNGWLYGPYNVDPGPGQLRPTGAFEAVRFQNRVYLVFADSLNSRYLSIARCDNSVYCASSWHDFGSGVFKKVVRSLAVLQGMSAVSASAIRGRWAYSDLYIAAGEYYGGRIFVTRVNSDDSTGTSFYIPDYYPSFTTISGLGIEARQSAFPFYLPPFGWANQNYLYLVWKDRNSSAIYTSVLQEAPSTGTYRFTKSQPAFYDAKANTGVSWAKGATVTDNIQGVFASPTNSMIYQFNGYGRY